MVTVQHTAVQGSLKWNKIRDRNNSISEIIRYRISFDTANHLIPIEVKVGFLIIIIIISSPIIILY